MIWRMEIEEYPCCNCMSMTIGAGAETVAEDIRKDDTASQK